MITTAQNILKTLGYFDLFQYPLTKEEIYSFHADTVSPWAVNNALEILVNEKIVFRLDEFYSLQNDHTRAQRRCAGNLLAAKQMKTAQKAALLLSKFPFTKGIAVSGSLSKKFADKNSDIDFFIVTAANRLWIARTFMHFYKKLTFLTGRQHWFCMNYYVDETELEIVEKNIFTAMEIITLIPMQGSTSFEKFFCENDWTKIFFPMHSPVSKNIPEIRQRRFVKIIEKIFSGQTGDRFDKWLMHITDRRWQNKTAKQQVNNKGRKIGMAVGRHFSKPDPQNFQAKVVRQYEDKVKHLLQQQNIAASILL